MSDAAPIPIERAYRVRLYPKPGQARMLSRIFGARRFAWNWALRRKDEAWRADGTQLTGIDLSREFTALRQAEETVWLSQLPREPFNQTLRDFDRAWSNFFAGRAKRPRRRKFGTVKSARFTLDQRRTGLVHRESGRVQLDGVGRVRFRVTEPMTGRLRSVTISRDAAGRWFASFTADGVARPEPTPATIPVIGIDLGLRESAVFSTGERVNAPKRLAAHLARLRRYQRHYVRQRDAAARRQGLNPRKPFPKGTRIEPSNRMLATKHRIGVLHARIADQRRDHQHQLTARVVNDAQGIAIEDLSLKGMARSMGRRAFRRSVADAGLGEIRRQISYKAQWRNRTVSVVERFYPSSKTCADCGAVNTTLALKDRRWACAHCGTEHDRDQNAAVNIAREGLRLLAETEPSTRRSRGTDAWGVDSRGMNRTPSIRRPTTANRELDAQCGSAAVTNQRRMDRRAVGEA